jgi:mannan endo-1,4-beta-mannosidase
MLACVWLALIAFLADTACHAAALSVEAKREAILAYLRELQSEHKTLVGVQVNEYEVYIRCTSYDRIVEQTGKRPALLGLELMNAIAYPPYAAYLTDRALTQEARGGLVTMSWHERNPIEVCPRGEFYECAKKPMTPAMFDVVLTDGTKAHKLWLADVNKIAKLLARWRKRGIVVLFRPYHEMNGNWFWWGQQDAYPRLWDALYDELAIRRHLDNLIWVWSADRDVPDAARYFPQRHKPDVVGIDVYESDPDSAKYAAGRTHIAALAGKTPFALTEVGLAPSRAVLEATDPAWVLLWGGEYLNIGWSWNNDCPICNKPEQVSALLGLDRIVTLAAMPRTLRAKLAAGIVHPYPLHKARPYCPASLIKEP